MAVVTFLKKNKFEGIDRENGPKDSNGYLVIYIRLHKKNVARIYCSDGGKILCQLLCMSAIVGRDPGEVITRVAGFRGAKIVSRN